MLLLIITILLNSGCVYSQMTDSMRQFIVDEHNKYKRMALGEGATDIASSVTATMMYEYEYDPIAECVAQAYLNSLPATGWKKNTFSHNANRNAQYIACGGATGSKVGENWYSNEVGSSDNHDSYGGGATRAWVDLKWSGCSERDSFFGTNGCAASPGHYTQVVWKSTSKVGCGFVPAWGTLCDYNTAGNIVGQQPFIVGVPCSSCAAPFSYCNNGLCSKTPPAITCAGLPTPMPANAGKGNCSSTSTAAGVACNLACNDGFFGTVAAQCSATGTWSTTGSCTACVTTTPKVVVAGLPKSIADAKYKKKDTPVTTDLTLAVSGLNSKFAPPSAGSGNVVIQFAHNHVTPTDLTFALKNPQNIITTLCTAPNCVAPFKYTFTYGSTNTTNGNWVLKSTDNVYSTAIGGSVTSFNITFSTTVC